MRSSEYITEVEVYWDAQDPQNECWAERVSYADNHQESGPCDLIDADQGLDALPDSVVGVAYVYGLTITADEVSVQRDDGGCGSWVRN